MICYTDGSCSGNPGPGGYGVIVLDNNYNFIDCKYYKDNNTTNNKMELSAILYVLENYGLYNENVTVYSDSSYAINVYTSWMYNWSRNNWLKKDNKIPENLDIIKKYYNLCQQGYRINLEKVKGHSDNLWNNIVDLLATGTITESEVKKLVEQNR